MGSVLPRYYYLLEVEGFTCWLLNAKHVKNVPGRPKTDKIDAVRLAKVVERGMCSPSLVHPKPIRQLRDLTRYRRSLIRERTREKQRVEKLLEDAQIKLSSVIADIFGVSGRQMLEALIAGQRSPTLLAQMAQGTMRAKTAVLQEALTGHFEDHHGFLLQAMLDHIDALTAQIENLGARIEDVIAPFSQDVERLDEITAVGKTAAQELIAEIGVDATRFLDAAHLVSWAKFAPIDHNSAGHKRGGATGRGNPWLAGTLGVIVASASRTDTFLGERYRRLARRRGKNRHRRGRQLGPDHHLAPTGRPRRPLQRPGLRPLPHEGQHPASGTRPHPPARTPHRQEGHPQAASTTAA